MSAQLKKNVIRTEDAPAYFPESCPHPDDEDAIIRQAITRPKTSNLTGD